MEGVVHGCWSLMAVGNPWGAVLVREVSVLLWDGLLTGEVLSPHQNC